MVFNYLISLGTILSSVPTLSWDVTPNLCLTIGGVCPDELRPWHCSLGSSYLFPVPTDSKKSEVRPEEEAAGLVAEVVYKWLDTS